MDVNLHEIIVWVIVGAIAGNLVARVVTGRKAGYGLWKNLGLGLAGGIVGGMLFVKLFDLDFGMSKITLSLQEVVAATLGAILVLLATRIVKRRGKKQAQKE